MLGADQSFKKILIVLPNWFGEVLFTTPFLGVLRRALPQAEIVAMGWPQTEAVLRHSSLINRFIAFDEKGAHRSFAAKYALSRELRAEGFDTAFLLRKSRSRAWLLALAGIPRRIGWSGSGRALTDALKPPPWGTSPPYTPGMDIWPWHKAATYMPLLEAVESGLSSQRAPCLFELVPDETVEAKQLLLDNGVLFDARPRVFVHPGANWRFKQWPPERFGALVRQLGALDVQCILSGGPSDAELCRRIKASAQGPLIDLQGKTTLRQLVSCLSYADVLVSNDTGVLHSAVAVGCPAVALYGPTSPVLTGPLGDSQKLRVLHHADCCPQIPCFEPEVQQAQGMRAIAVDEVYNAARELLKL